MDQHKTTTQRPLTFFCTGSEYLDMRMQGLAMSLTMADKVHQGFPEKINEVGLEFL